MNQDLRKEDSDGDNTVIMDDVEDYLADERTDLSNPGNGLKGIGDI